jgi:hypothetical protein
LEVKKLARYSSIDIDAIKEVAHGSGLENKEHILFKGEIFLLHQSVRKNSASHLQLLQAMRKQEENNGL